MIFVSGVHGAGKSYFCNLAKENLGIKSYSASQLIASRRNEAFLVNKYVSNIDDNQSVLLDAINELRHTNEEFILDGHFCLLNNEGVITRISYSTFELLKPNIIILLTEKPNIIAERRFQRDNICQNVFEITNFQNAEIIYATEISKKLNITLEMSKGEHDLERILKIIKGGGY